MFFSVLVGTSPYKSGRTIVCSFIADADAADRSSVVAVAAAADPEL